MAGGRGLSRSTDVNLTVGYVSQLEGGAKPSAGAALALLTITTRKGIEAIL